MELMDLNTEDKVIYQHNMITSGRYDYSACMLDILFMILSGLEKGRKSYTIQTKDIELITGRKWNYKQLRDSTEIIGSRMFEIETPDSYEQIWLFSSIKYLKGTGSFTVTLSDTSLPLLFDLKNNFTAMQLKSVLNCTSKYAKRIYALACQWRVVGQKRFEISEFKKILGLIDKKGKEQFTEMPAFRKKVLDIAMFQINEYTDIKLEYELLKRGRSFYWIAFKINPQTPKQLEIDFGKSIGQQKLQALIMSYGLNLEQAEAISEKETEEGFKNLIDDLNAKVLAKKITVKNSIGYLIGVYQKKGILPIKA